MKKYTAKNMNESEFKHRIAEGESESLELKSAIPPPEQIAHILASFANTNGGSLIIGIKEPNQIVGTNVRRAQLAIQAAKQHIVPPLNIQVELIEANGHPVLIASVKKSGVLVSASGGYYRRDSDRARPLTADEIAQRALADKNQQGALTELSTAIARQTQTIDSLRLDFNRANSPAIKIALAALGAAAGVILKYLAESFL
jgi:predicted HTH transcriptional regulator